MHKNFNETYHFIDKFKEADLIKLNLKISLIYRNYEKKVNVDLIKKIKKFCRKTNRKFYLANEIKLAFNLGLDGAYIPSFNKTAKYMNLENKNLDILGSAHNYIEIKKKVSQKCRAIFISPIFPVKKNNNFLNIYKFNFLSLQTKNEVFALGGISEKNFNKLKLLKINGFGGISLFKKKPAYKRPAFLKNFFF